MPKKTFSLDLGNGTSLKVETGQLAQQTNASALVSIGGTQVLATACMSRKPQNLDFLPLVVSYQEKYYAAGMIAHSKVNKREGRPTDDKVLTARVIDRTIRPIFPKGLTHDLQTILTVMSYDNENEHDMVAGVGASVVFTISDIPFDGPTAMVRVGLINGAFILNPTVSQRKESDLDLIVSSTEEAVVMIEAQANEVSEEKMIEAIEFGFEAGKKICKFIKDIAKEIGKEKIQFTPKKVDERIEPLLREKYEKIITETIFDESLTKLERFGRFDDLKEEASELISSEFNEEDKISSEDVKAVFETIIKNVIRRSILKEEKRIKGRKLDEIRPLSCEIDILDRVHGSGLFNRGETQGLSIVTLGGPESKLYKTGIEGEIKCRYFHHYNFPPFSVGEISNRLYTGNREIGHGALGEKALIPMLPKEADFPYTIRVVTEILSSNGSSSMASVCGSTLALMAAGVPIKKPVSGIAMGLMTDKETGEYKVLTDLQDEEDFGGDMDFKVAGTKDGITAIQMDIKLKGIPINIFKEAFKQARKGRLEILEAMLSVISEPRKELSQYAPRLESIQIELDQIRSVIGKGGETINKIIDATGVEISISEEGIVSITGGPGADMDKAIRMVQKIVEKPEVGKIYEGKVIKIMDFGAFVEILPHVEGLVHVSVMKKERVNHPSEVVKEGEIVRVKLLEIDKQGRYKLSMVDAV